MATIDSKLSKVFGSDGTHQVIVRLTVTRNFRPCFKSGVFVEPKYFRSIDCCKEYKDFGNYDIFPPKKSKLNFIEVKIVSDAKNSLDTFINRLLKICQETEAKKVELTKEFIDEALKITKGISTDDITYNFIIDALLKEKERAAESNRILAKRSFFDLMDEYANKSKKKSGVDKSIVWKKNFNVLYRALKRYEMFIQLSDRKRKQFILDIDTINSETIEDIESYLRNEHTLYEEYPKIFSKFSTVSNTNRNNNKPQPRGNNTICALFNKLRAFYNWCEIQGYTTNRPFLGYSGITTEKYGTPYYLTLDERNIIADFDLSNHPELAIQRDIFIFQCCIGCRVSDLLRLTNTNIINGSLEYIPTKTKGDRPTTISVPLNDRAKTLVDKYNGGKMLFPFISAQKYNDDIKSIFTICGITRMVTVLNPTTGKEEQKPINEVASSHMARRTFVGNLYKKLKDPNLICPLSGHKEGSKAFARYREIDDEIKKQVVSLID